LALAAQFQRVVASDPSAAQIAHAAPHPRVEYRVEAAERPSLDAASVDLVTVAQALHWFDLEAFHDTVARVLRPGGVIAEWTYALSAVSAAVDRVFLHLHDELLADHWPPERRHVASGYRTLAFPFTRIEAPPFAMQTHWTLPQYLDYLRSWSASQRYRDATGEDAVSRLTPAFEAAWGDPASVRAVRWPLSLRAGRVNDRAAVRGDDAA
jgi:SAM-dependent methyltransferase